MVRPRNRGLPRWAKGKKVLEHYSGFEYYERDGKLSEQEGKLVDRQNLDDVTDKMRAENIKRISK